MCGDLVGTGTVEMLAARSPSGGAGYVALERIEGTLAGKTGTFALLHLGTMDGSGESGHWPIVPGSGTGDLRGVSGTAKIERTEAGEHRVMLTCAWS